MKNSMLTLIVLSSLTTMVQAGEGGAHVVCQSSSGKTKLELFSNGAGDRGLDLSLQNPDNKTVTTVNYFNKAAVSNHEINGGSIQKDYPNAKIGPIVEVVNGDSINYVVLDVRPNGDDSEIMTLRSVPGSVHLRNGAYDSVKGTFKAKLWGQDPRSEEGAYLEREITLNCTYEYSI